MSGYHQTIVIGHLGRDPKTRQAGQGQVCSFSIAVSEKWDGGEHTEWYQVEVWGKQADACQRYLSKGRQALVTGTLRTEEYTDKDGVLQRRTKLRATNVQFIGAPAERQDQPPRAPSDRPQRPAAQPHRRPEPYRAPEPPLDYSDDESPF